MCICASLIYSFTFISYSQACVGARPMAMGGAFIGVADDATATYWNPAGLDQTESQRDMEMEQALIDLEGIELHYTATLFNRDEYNYDDFVSVTTPLKFRNYDFGNAGFSFMNNIDVPFEAEWGKIRLTNRWYWLSYGKTIVKGLSAGINLRYEDFKDEFLLSEGWGIDINGDGIVDIIGPATLDEDNDDAFVLDAGLLWKLGKFSLGLLVQSANEPKIFGVKSIRNVRPGLAFRPDNDTVFSLDMYDATGETDDLPNSVAQDIRIGFERWFDLPKETPHWIGQRLAIRGGGYHINNSNMRAYTFGFGLKGKSWKGEDEWFKSAQLDYTLMYWTDSGEADSVTHQLGLTFDF